MRSKWLEWTRGSEVIGKEPDMSPTKPAKPSSVGSEGEPSAAFSIIHDPACVGPVDDAARRARVRAVLCALPELPAMTEWLQEEQPEVWARCCSLLRHIDAVWFARSPEFEWAITGFVAAFGDARELYRVHLQKHPQGVLESLQASNAERCE
jgi:hypothetical protein